MKILLSGAGGFLGSYIADQLLQRGHYVRAITRPTSVEPKWAGEVDLFHADLRVHENLVSAFSGIDAVIHAAAATSGNEDAQFASTVVGTERLLAAMALSSVKRIVHVSSLVVYDWAQAASVLDEDTPLLNDIYDMGAYTIAKVWQERVVLRYAKSHSWDLTIMRPGFIWGPKHAEIAGMGRRFGRIHIIFGPFTRLPLSHVVNCADCIVAAVENSAAAGIILNVVDGDDIRAWRYAREYSRRSETVHFLLPVPYHLGLFVARLAAFVSRALFGKKGKLPSLLVPRRFQSQFKPVRFSSRNLKKVLAWRPPSDFKACLRLTFDTKR